MAENYVKFRRGTPDEFKAITPDSDTLYFIENPSLNTFELYLGSKKITDGVENGGTVSPVDLSLDDLTDVVIKNVGDGHVLVYDNIDQQWENKSIADVIEDAISNLSTNITITIINSEDKPHSELFPTKRDAENDLINGDILIIKDKIRNNTNKYQHTAYVFYNNEWTAMDGNYDAENVYFDEDFIFTEDIGTIIIPESGNVVVPAAGKNLKEFFSSVFAQEKNPETTYPTATITVANGNGEVGSEYTLPKATLTVTDGAYTYGAKESGIKYDAEDTGVTFAIGDVILKENDSNSISNTSIFKNNELSLNAAGTKGVYTDNAQTYSFEGMATYTPNSNRVPLTNIGNLADIKYQIGYDESAKAIQDKVEVSVSGNKTATFTGWRKMFMGVVNEYNSLTGNTPITITSDVIRNLNLIKDGSGKPGVQVSTSAKTFTVPVGSTKIIIACPKTHELAKCEYFTMSWETIANFSQVEDVQVADARGGANGLMDYNIYVFTHSNPSGFETDTQYRITLKKA